MVILLIFLRIQMLYSVSCGPEWTPCWNGGQLEFCQFTFCAYCPDNAHCNGWGLNNCQGGFCVVSSNQECLTLFPTHPINLNGGCYSCTSPQECASNYPTTPKCANSGACVQCFSSTDCPYLKASFCDPNSESCIPCVQNQEECSQFLHYSYCNLGTCVNCLKSLTCNLISQAECINNECQPCKNSEPCLKFQDTPCCLVTNGTCVQCLVDSDCTTAGLPFCVNNLCVQCIANINCAGTYPNPYCAIDNSCQNCTTGYPECFSCANSSDCQYPYYPVCNETKNICFPCSNNSDCSNIKNFPNCVELPNGTYKCTSLLSNFERDEQLIVPDEETEILLNVTSTTPLYQVSWGIKPNIIQIKPEGHISFIPQFDSITTNIESGNGEFILSAIVNNAFDDTTYSSLRLSIKPPSIDTQIFYSIIKAIVDVTIGCVGITLIMGGSSGGILNLMRLLLFILFQNVDYPQILNNFLTIFTSCNLFALPNIFAWFPFQMNSQIPSPQKFSDHGLSGLFIATSGSSIMGVLLIIFTGIVAKMVLILNCKQSRFRNFLINISLNCSWDRFLELSSQLFSEVIVCAILQLIQPIFLNWTNIISYTLGLVAILFSLFLLFIFYKKSQKWIPSYYAHNQIVQILGVIKKGSPTAKYVFFFSMLKTTLMCFTLVLLYNFPIYQVLSCLISSTSYSLVIIFLKPWESKLDMLFNISQETVFVIIFSMIQVMAIQQRNGEPMNYDFRFNLGKGVIAFITALLLLQFGSSIILLIQAFKKSFKARQKRKRRFRRNNLMLQNLKVSTTNTQISYKKERRRFKRRNLCVSITKTGTQIQATE